MDADSRRPCRIPDNGTRLVLLPANALRHRWRIAAPRTETTITYPKLPIVDFDFNPAASDTVSVDELTTIALPGGFAGFRTQAFNDPRSAIAGTLGRIVQQDLYSEPL